jgi:hypothetical protein
MAIVINHASTQRDNNDDFSPHDIDEKGRRGNGGHGSYSGDGRGSYDERYNNDNVVDNHNRTDHNRKDHFIDEGRGEGRSRGGDCRDDRDGDRDGRRCFPKTKAPIVLAPVVAVAAGTTTVGAFDDTVVIQVLNNVAVIATYTLVLQPLQSCDTGYIVIETAGGITAVTVIGASNVSPSALTTPGSSVVLKWNGCVWVQV